MTRHVHIEPVGGIAGDMFVSAMLDAFPDSIYSCWKDLEQAGVLEHVAVKLEKGTSKGLAAKRFCVNPIKSQPKRTGNYRELQQWLQNSDLMEPVKYRALSLLQILAKAESEVHDVDIEQVHFHEVADWDSVADIVAAASVIEHNNIDSWSCGALPLGSGLVNTEHGFLPVPAPATARLLRGLDVWDDSEPGERVTPTGAAIIRYLMTGKEGKLQPTVVRPSGVLCDCGTGAGQRELQNRPNIVRCVIIDSAYTGDLAPPDHFVDQVVEIKFDIDDMTAEEMSVSLSHIRAGDGVLDASYCLGVGKKGRAIFKIAVLCTTDCEQSSCNLCFHETTTLGVRVQHIDRRLLQRVMHQDADDIGSMGIKVAKRPYAVTAKVESDDLASVSGLHARRLKASKLSKKYES